MVVAVSEGGATTATVLLALGAGGVVAGIDEADVALAESKLGDVGAVRLESAGMTDSSWWCTHANVNPSATSGTPINSSINSASRRPTLTPSSSNSTGCCPESAAASPKALAWSAGCAILCMVALSAAPSRPPTVGPTSGVLAQVNSTSCRVR
jgi:hypothetical protein